MALGLFVVLGLFVLALTAVLLSVAAVEFSATKAFLLLPLCCECCCLLPDLAGSTGPADLVVSLFTLEKKPEMTAPGGA